MVQMKDSKNVCFIWYKFACLGFLYVVMEGIKRFNHLGLRLNEAKRRKKSKGKKVVFNLIYFNNMPVNGSSECKEV